MAGGGIKPGISVHAHDFQATLLHCLGIDHKRLTHRFQDRDYRLTDVSALHASISLSSGHNREVMCGSVEVAWLSQEFTQFALSFSTNPKAGLPNRLFGRSQPVCNLGRRMTFDNWTF